MGAYTGLAEAAYQGFMDPYTKRQDMAREDQWQAEQGQRIKQALMGILPNAFPNAAQGLFDSIMQADPRTMGTVAPIVTGQAQYGQQRADRQGDIATATKQAEDERARKRQANAELLRVAGLPQYADMAANQDWTDAQVSRVIENEDAKRRTTQSVDSLNAWARSKYPGWRDAPTPQAIMDEINNQQGIERDTRTLDRQMTMYNTRQQPETEPGIKDTGRGAPQATLVRGMLGQVRDVNSLNAVLKDPSFERAMTRLSDINPALYEQLNDELDELDAQIRGFGAQQGQDPNQQRQTGFDPQGMQNAPVNKTVDFMKKPSKYGVW